MSKQTTSPDFLACIPHVIEPHWDNVWAPRLAGFPVVSSVMALSASIAIGEREKARRSRPSMVLLNELACARLKHSRASHSQFRTNIEAAVGSTHTVYYEMGIEQIVVVLGLHEIEVTVPEFVRFARIPPHVAVVEVAVVTNLMAGIRTAPCVQQRVSNSLG